jgi:hypothetical protein
MHRPLPRPTIPNNPQFTSPQTVRMAHALLYVHSVAVSKHQNTNFISFTVCYQHPAVYQRIEQEKQEMLNLTFSSVLSTVVKVEKQ